jgi:hypothetical protein
VVHIDSILEARALAAVVPQIISAADTDPAYVVQYVPALGTGGTAATCEVVTATYLRFQVDAADPAGLDAIGNTEGKVLFATYTNVGLLTDYVNGQGAWRMYLVGAIRSDATASQVLDDGGTPVTCFGDAGLTIPHDTSACDHISVAISGERFVNNGITGHETDAYDRHSFDRCENHLLYAGFQLTFTGTGTINFYSESQTEAGTQIGAAQALTSTTLLEFGATNWSETYIMATVGERLVVRAATTTAFSAYTQYRVVGKTVVLGGTRYVSSKPYPDV